PRPPTPSSVTSSARFCCWSGWSARSRRSPQRPITTLPKTEDGGGGRKKIERNAGADRQRTETKENPMQVDKEKGMMEPAREDIAEEGEHAVPSACGVLDLTDPEFLTSAYGTYSDLRDKGRVVRVSVPAVEQSEDDEENNSAFADVFGQDSFFV